MRSGSATKYHTLSIDELKAIPVSDIAVKDSILFLWVTTPLLPAPASPLPLRGRGDVDLVSRWGRTREERQPVQIDRPGAGILDGRDSTPTRGGLQADDQVLPGAVGMTTPWQNGRRGPRSGP